MIDKMKPILFNTEMVKAILEGKKTVTRRVVKEKGWNIIGRPKFAGNEFWFYVCMENKEVNSKTATCHLLKPPYNVGDILYVRETWEIQSAHRFECDAKIAYKAGGDMHKIQFETREDYDKFVWNKHIGDGRWYPSIHMPKEAARILLQVKDVRVERLQEIDCEGARKEGCDGRCDVPSNGAEGVLSCVAKDFSIERFQTVWDETIPKHPNKFKRYPYYWNDNPWVWVIEFERIS